MAKTKSKVRKASNSELDGVYLLKLVLYMIVGMQWIWFENGTSRIPIPIGLIIGFMFAQHDHFKIDRKIEYAVLLVAMFIGFWIQAGVFVRY